MYYKVCVYSNNADDCFGSESFFESKFNKSITQYNDCCVMCHAINIIFNNYSLVTGINGKGKYDRHDCKIILKKLNVQ